MAFTDPVDTGVASIDIEHRQIAALFHLLHDALEISDLDTARNLYSTLNEKLADHFRREELLLVRNDYPNSRLVAAEHRAAMTSLAAFGDSLGESAPQECLETLNELLYGFISCVYTDLGCMQYFLRLGIDPSAFRDI